MQVSSSKYCCAICHKEYTRKASLDKHKILCDFKLKTQREHQVDFEELGDVPTHYELVKIVQEMALKMDKMQERLNEFEKWVDKKKKKLNVVAWLNGNVNPSVGYLEWVKTCIVVKREHFESLMENTLFYTIQKVFDDNLSDGSFVYPIRCFSQKQSVFYICSKLEDGSPQWRQLTLEDFVLLLKTVQNNMIRELTKWKTENKERFDENDKLSVLFNKAIIKLMNISFTQDATLGRIKNGLYNLLKKDMKREFSEVELEFN